MGFGAELAALEPAGAPFFPPRHPPPVTASDQSGPNSSLDLKSSGSGAGYIKL